MTLKPGRYRLTKAIVNPALDKRTRYDWRTCRGDFPVGTRSTCRRI